MKNKKHEGTTRAFTRSHKAWYAEANKITQPEIMIGLYYPEGSGAGEFAIEWVKGLAPQLRAYNDSWSALAEFQDLLTELARVDGQDITEPELYAILVMLGIEDWTQYEKPAA